MSKLDMWFSWIAGIGFILGITPALWDAAWNHWRHGRSAGW